MIKGVHLEQSRARFAFQEVNGWKPPISSNAATRAKGLPVEIRSLGLPVSLAVLLRESKNERGRAGRLLADSIARWVLGHAPHLGKSDSKENDRSAKELLRRCLDAERATYLAYQREALAIAEQIKLFADALHGGEEA